MDANYDTTDEFTAWEAAAWLGVSVEKLMELAHEGQIPPPRTLAPITWHESDLVRWMTSGCPTKETI